jgi:hypothetical protein
MTKPQFWRMSASATNWCQQLPTDLQLRGSLQPRPGDGVVIGDIDESSQLILVSHVGVTERVLGEEGLLQVNWRPAHFVLEPTPSGARYWRDRDHFRFDDDVAERYQLSENFTDAFGEDDWTDNRRRFKDE